MTNVLATTVSSQTICDWLTKGSQSPSESTAQLADQATAAIVALRDRLAEERSAMRFPCPEPDCDEVCGSTQGILSHHRYWHEDGEVTAAARAKMSAAAKGRWARQRAQQA